MKLIATALVIATLTAANSAQTSVPQAPIGTTMPAAAAPTSQMAPGTPATVYGRVVTAVTGKALRRALVRLNLRDTSNAEFTREMLTDADGRYRFEGLPAGEYVAYSWIAGFLRRSEVIDVGAGAARRIDFALPRGGVISGRIIEDTGEPSAGIRLVPLGVQHSPNGERIGIPMYARLDNYTDDRGDFRVTGLSPGTYLLAAQLRREPIGESCATTYYPGTTDPNAAHRVQVGSGEHVTANFSLPGMRPEVACRVFKLTGWSFRAINE